VLACDIAQPLPAEISDYAAKLTKAKEDEGISSSSRGAYLRQLLPAGISNYAAKMTKAKEDEGIVEL